MCAIAAASIGIGPSGRQAVICATSACVRVRNRSARAWLDICDVLVSPDWDKQPSLAAIGSLAWPRDEYRPAGPKLALSRPNLSCTSHCPALPTQAIGRVAGQRLASENAFRNGRKTTFRVIPVTGLRLTTSTIPAFSTISRARGALKFLPFDAFSLWRIRQ
jgi:hypothetical protein